MQGKPLIHTQDGPRVVSTQVIRSSDNWDSLIVVAVRTICVTPSPESTTKPVSNPEDKRDCLMSVEHGLVAHGRSSGFAKHKQMLFAA